MQATPGGAVNPLVSIVTTLAFPRRHPVECLCSWTSGQRFAGAAELVVVSDARRPRLERQVRAALGPADRLLRLPGADEIAQYELGARAARGEWLLFTEPHVEALPDCLAELLEHVRRHGLAGACVRTLPGHERSRVARMEARMYQQDAAGWSRDGDWRTFTKRGVLVARAAYLDAGGLDPARGRFAETALARRLADRGHGVGFAPRAQIRHQNSTKLRELLVYVWEYRRQELAEAELPVLAGAGEDSAWKRAAPGVISDALRVARGRWRDASWRGLVARLLRLRVALALPAGAGRWAAAWSPARRSAFAWMRFHRPLKNDERSYAAYTELWRATGDLAVATCARRPLASGLHEAESFQGTPFRWTAPIAALRVGGGGRIVLKLAGVRAVGPHDVLVYRGATRLTPVAEASSATELVLDGTPDEGGPVTIICPPLPTGGGGDRRSLALPLVAVHAGDAEACG